MIDKAKAYDEALENARKLRDDCQKELNKTDKTSRLADLLRSGIGAVEIIFPQLKESDDEKIRQAIIKSIKEDSSVYEQEVSKEQMLAYLEKQKEQKSISAEEVLARAGLKHYKDGNMWCIFIGDNIQEGICGFGDTIDEAFYQFLMEVLEIQKKQKPVNDKSFEEWIDSWFKEHKEKAYPQITMDEKEFKNFCRGIRNMYQQKPNWSEKDEKIIKTIIGVLERNSQVVTYEQRGGLMSASVGYSNKYEEEIAWLKDISLNHKKFIEAVDKLCSNEWSEEDKEALDMCLDAIPKKWKTKSGILLTKWLKDNIHLQPKQEWSEEDENMAYFVNQFLEYHENADPTAKSCKKWFNNRFKSFKSHWKPTKEHINAIEECLEFYAESTDTYRHLKSLLSELVKL